MSPEQQFAQQMSKLNAAYQGKFFDALHAFFADTIFPAENIPENFYRSGKAPSIHAED